MKIKECCRGQRLEIALGNLNSGSNWSVHICRINCFGTYVSYGYFRMRQRDLTGADVYFGVIIGELPDGLLV